MGVSRQNISPKRKGTSQHSRLSEKLLPQWFSVDERTPADFLAFSAAYANEIAFYDPQAEAKGNTYTWQRLFTKDISVVLAAIISLDIDRIDATFEHHVQMIDASFEPAQKRELFETGFQFLVDLASKLPAWLRMVVLMNAERGTLEYEVEKELWKVIEQNEYDALLQLNEMVLQSKGKGLLVTFHDVPFSDYLPWKVMPTLKVTL